MRLFLAICLFIVTPLMAVGQIVRPPDLKLQFHRAERAYRTGSSLLEAKSRLDAVISELPDDAEAILLRAKVLLQLGRTTAARTDAARAATLLPESGEAQLFLAEAARASGNLDEAMTALDNAASLISDGVELHIRLSFNAQMLGDLDQAEAYARVALNQDPTSPGAHRQLARVFVDKNRLQAAATILSGGLERGILLPQDISKDAKLEGLRSRPELRRWFQN